MIFRSLAIVALVSPFFFPWTYTVAITIIVMFRYPSIALAVGLELDALYFVPGAASVPLATAWGALAMVFAWLIRRFVRTQMLFN